MEKVLVVIGPADAGKYKLLIGIKNREEANYTQEEEKENLGVRISLTNGDVTLCLIRGRDTERQKKLERESFAKAS